MPDRRDAIAQAALSHVGCSEVLHVDVYADVIIRPVDRTPQLAGYYEKNPKLSTCALFVMGVLRLAGCTADEACATYFPAAHPMRNAMADAQNLARRFGAWVTSSPPVPAMKKGDIWIIGDAQGMDAHTGVCTADAVVNPDGSWTVQTAEGGQTAYDENHRPSAAGGSSGIEAFTRHFVPSGNRMMDGQRFLLGYASADKMPVPDGFTPGPDAGAASATDTKTAA